jgi:hypothetical protein
MDDSPIAAPPDGWFSENLLGHFQTGPNGRIHLELDVARKVHATFGEVGRFTVYSMESLHRACEV